MVEPKADASARLAAPQGNDRLDSWKEIAAYLKREVRTVQRWEDSEGLPVHRHEHKTQSTVYAYKSEVDSWWKERRPRLEQEPPEAEPASVVPEASIPPVAGSQVREQSGDARPAPSWRVAAGVVAVLLAVAAGAAWMLRGCRPPPGNQAKVMIVVLPFDNVGNDPAQEYIADGFTDEMIMQLGRLEPERLGVIARTTAMQYKKTTKSVDEIGRELGVQYILEGAVRRDADRVRVTPRLIQVSDQSHLWADSYDRELRDILKVQAEVAEAIAGQIRVKLTASGSPPGSVDPEAYEAYLQGLSNWNKRDLQHSIQYYNQAVAKDPNYALAYAGLAEAYTVLGSIPVDVLPPREVRPRAKDAAKRALQLDPALDEAHLSLANAYLHYDWDWAAAEREFKKALELNPSNPRAHEWHGHFLIVRGKPQEALNEMKHARELDPLNEIMNSAYIEAYYYSRQYDQAIEQGRRALELYPNSFYIQFWLGSAYREKKMYPEAIATFGRAKAASGNNPWMVLALGHAYSVSGNTAEAKNAITELERISRTRYVPALYTAVIYIGLGDKDKAFQWLNKAFAERTDRLVYLNAEPVADPLRSDPRFRDLARRIGLTP